MVYVRVTCNHLLKIATAGNFNLLFLEKLAFITFHTLVYAGRESFDEIAHVCRLVFAAHWIQM